MDQLFSIIERRLSEIFSNIKIMDKVLSGMQGSYVELLTVLSLGLLAVIPVIVPSRGRQFWRHLNQVFGVVIFIFVVFTCLGVFGMIRNFFRGLTEIGRENILALYYCSVPVTILATSLLFGPAFCGWVCPTGALQEFTGFLARKTYMKWKKNNFKFSMHIFIMALVILFIFILWMYRLGVTRIFFIEDATIYWSEVLIILVFILSFKMKEWNSRLRNLKKLSFIVIVAGAAIGIKITSPVHFGFAKVYDPASLLSTVMVMLSVLVVPNIWCRYLCPWRCAIGWAGRHSVRRIELDESKCTSCRKCSDVCSLVLWPHDFKFSCI